MLNSFYPFSLIDTTVCPLHFSISIAFVVLVLSFVYVARGPDEHSVPVLFVSDIVPLVLVDAHALAAFPPALAVFESRLELAHVKRPIRPRVLSFAIRLAVVVLARVDVAVPKDVRALPVLQTLTPLAFVTIAVLPRVHSVSLRFG